MTIDPQRDTYRLLGALFDTGTIAGLSDRELLERFVCRRDPAAEVAFAELVRRHGPMVLRVCRAALRHEHDAHDAFQAVFLVLVHKAGSLQVRDSLGPWLQSVSLRITACARATAARRVIHERRRSAMAAQSRADQFGDDQEAVLHEEVGRLPERFRTVVVLCDLEGLTHEAVARQLGCPVGTVKSRQARGRARLGARLIRRGLGPSAGAVGWAASSTTVSAAVPAALAEATVKIAMRFSLGKTAMAGLVSTPVVALVERGLQGMLLSKIKLVAVPILAASLVTTGVVIVAYSSAGQEGRFATGQEKDLGKAPESQQKSEPPRAEGNSGPPAAGRPSPEEELLALLQQYDAAFATFGERKAVPKAKAGGDRGEPGKQFKSETDRIIERLLDLAVRNPGTNVAERALIWLAQHARFQPEGDQARDLLARDHARSDRLGTLFTARHDLKFSWQTKSAENLLRNALEQSPYRDTRGLACYWLAEYYRYQAEMIRRFRVIGSENLEAEQRLWRIDRQQVDRLLKTDPKGLEDEAERLYERVIAEFANVANTDDRSIFLPAPVLGQAAKAPLFALRRLSAGKTIPEIEGVDLEGKPMKLSDYRGKFVVLYVDRQLPPGVVVSNIQQVPTATFGALARKLEGKPLVFLGVVTGTDREAFKTTVQAIKPSAHFWWDPPGPQGKEGPIHTEWDASSPNILLIDPEGTIRSTGLFLYFRGDELETAISKVVNELDEELERDKKKP